VKHVSYWDRLAASYDDLYKDRWSWLEDEHLAKRVRRLYAEAGEGSVLDIGCGTGLGLEMLPEGANYYGVDVSPRMIAVAKAKHPAYRHHFQASDMVHLKGVPSDSFDLVISLHGPLSYCRDPWRASIEIARVLRPGGRFILTAMNRTALWRLRNGWQYKHVFMSSRGDDSDPSMKAEVFTRSELKKLFDWADPSVSGLSMLGRVCEFWPLWPADRLACLLAPGLAYGHIVTGRKRHEQAST